MGFSDHLIPSSSSVIPIFITVSLLIPIAFPIVDHAPPSPFEDLWPPAPDFYPPFDPSFEDNYKCLPSNKSFNSNYNQSLALVLSDLTSNTSSLDGFRNASYNWGPGDEPAYGLALCRGNVSRGDCNTCVQNATLAVTQHCPDSRAAIIWYANCFVKYSDVDFFGTLDTDNKFTAESSDNWENNNSTNSVVIFKRKLYRNATESPVFYAQMMAHIKWDWVTVYGAAQCTRDLSQNDCKKCLYLAATNTPANRTGATIAYGSCNNFLENNEF